VIVDLYSFLELVGRGPFLLPSVLLARAKDGSAETGDFPSRKNVFRLLQPPTDRTLKVCRRQLTFPLPAQKIRILPLNVKKRSSTHRIHRIFAMTSDETVFRDSYK
jgi:hypothetical protein